MSKYPAYSQKLHIIYVPGLGDREVRHQSSAVRTWSWWGVEPEIFQMNWGDKEAWEPKFDHLLARIDDLYKQDKLVGLVGVSAGASAVINAYAARKDVIVGVVCIAGKINGPELIGPRYQRRNPAFVTSAYDCVLALKTLNESYRKRILSRYGVFDSVVLKSDSRIEGARNRLSPSVGHVLTIATQILIGAPGFLHFLKHQAKNLPIKT